MKKKSFHKKQTFICRIALMLLALYLLFVSGCAVQQEDSIAVGNVEQPSNLAEEVTFIDALEREITVSNPQRVAPLIGSFADIWCLAGGRDSMVATANDAWTQFDLDLEEDVVNLGMTKEINTELLLEAEPDFVIASSNTAADIELLPMLEELGINVAYFKVSTFEEYLNMLDICTQITGVRENFQKYGKDVRTQVDQALEMADGSKPSVLYVRASGSGYKVKNSQNSVLGEMLKALDCVNIADGGSIQEDLSMEAILQEDPEYIFIVAQGTDREGIEEGIKETLFADPAWNNLAAVSEGNCYFLDQSLYNLKPNARWGEAYVQLAQIIYHEQ